MAIQKISSVNVNQSNSKVMGNTKAQLALPQEMKMDSANFSQKVAFKGDCGKVETAIMLACAATQAGR